MKRQEDRLKTEVERWFEEAERMDREEDELYGADKSGDELPEWVSNKQERLKRIQQAKAELEAEAKAEAERGPDPNKTGHRPKPTGTPAEKTQRNLTDSESRLMKSGDGFLQGYNAQAAVDAHCQIIVAQGLTNNGSDMHQMIPLLKQISRNLRRQAKEVSADSGYCSELNLKALQRHHIRGYISTRLHRKHRKVGRWIQRMRQRLAQGARRSRYRLRKQIVEPVFGQIKIWTRVSPVSASRSRQSRWRMESAVHGAQLTQTRIRESVKKALPGNIFLPDNASFLVIDACRVDAPKPPIRSHDIPLQKPHYLGGPLLEAEKYHNAGKHRRSSMVSARSKSGFWF